MTEGRCSTVSRPARRLMSSWNGAVMTARLDDVTKRKQPAYQSDATKVVCLANKQGLSLTGPDGHRALLVAKSISDADLG